VTASRIPPRFVPTLTEVVHSPPASATAAGPADAASQEQLIRRVMQRVDLTLDRRLREAIATTVLEQTRALTPLLREQIESLVRQTVSQALADESAASQRSVQPEP
jgi:hypothetical protein